MLKNSPKYFVLSFCFTLLIVPFLFMTFNIIVDPYWFFNLINIKGFNSIKPQLTHQVRLVKSHQICRQQPTNIIMGSSRAEVAFDPNSPTWHYFPGVTYNMGMNSLGIDELYKSIQHSYYASNNLNLIIIALDFFMFNAYRESVIYTTEVLNFDEHRLLHSKSDSCLKSFVHDFSFFLGWKAALASWATIFEKNTVDENKRDLNLLNGLRDPMRNSLKIVSAENGHRFIFDRLERDFVDRIWRAGPEKRYSFTLKDNNTLDTFRKIISFAHENNLDLRLLIGPEHARMLLAMKEAHLWIQFEDWKREMVRIINEEAKNYNKPPFDLWDFSGFNSVTIESIPAGGDKSTHMAWYWEGSHYKQQTGEVILKKVLDSPNLSSCDISDFGVKLSPSILEFHLKDIRAKMSLYEKKSPKEAKYIKTVVDDVLNRHYGKNSSIDTSR